MASVLDKELIQYFTRLDEPQKKSLLSMIKSFIQPNEGLLGSITMEQYNQELDEAMERMDKGHFTTLEELEKEMQTW
ncbi:MAG: hypothetical protein LBE82_13470 [Chitinophagaceae bacterium]|jgi:hypothetical protein|nr:hypothetical protein [Chitinophagaceae bacterium]